MTLCAWESVEFFLAVDHSFTVVDSSARVIAAAPAVSNTFHVSKSSNISNVFAPFDVVVAQVFQ